MFTQRSVLALTICAALLLPTPSGSWLSVGAAQNEGRRARPRHAQPEGIMTTSLRGTVEVSNT
jgi:hypothetical protein